AAACAGGAADFATRVAGPGRNFPSWPTTRFWKLSGRVRRCHFEHQIACVCAIPFVTATPTQGNKQKEISSKCVRPAQSSGSTMRRALASSRRKAERTSSSTSRQSRRRGSVRWLRVRPSSSTWCRARRVCRRRTSRPVNSRTIASEREGRPCGRPFLLYLHEHRSRTRTSAPHLVLPSGVRTPRPHTLNLQEHRSRTRASALHLVLPSGVRTSRPHTWNLQEHRSRTRASALHLVLPSGVRTPRPHTLNLQSSRSRTRRPRPTSFSAHLEFARATLADEGVRAPRGVRTSRPHFASRIISIVPPTIVAILAAYNEERFIAGCLENLFANGLEAYLCDNESTDRTVAIAQAYLGHGLRGIETIPRDGTYRWKQILMRKEQLAATLNADWFLHVDPDEILQSPRPGETLAAAITAADGAGYSAIEFHELTFVPTREDPDHDHPRFRETMRWYYPFAPRPLHHVIAWKRQ